MTTTERIARHAEAAEQHEADLALVNLDRALAIRFGVTEADIDAASARVAAYKPREI